MTEPYSFSPRKIEDHVEKVGVDIRPVIELKSERAKLHTIGEQLVSAHPEIFESLVQAPTDFRIMKKFIFPGKGEAELTTLAFTQRGPVFTFPRQIAVLKEEIDLGRLDDITMDCLRAFRSIFPEKKIIRVGLLNEYVFDTGELDSTRLVCERFTRLPVPVGGEIRLRINRRDDDHNRIIDLEALRKLERIPEIPDQLQPAGYGVKVTVDFNNVDMTHPLDDGRILRVLHEGRRYNEDDLYRFLNGDFGGEG